MKPFTIALASVLVATPAVAKDKDVVFVTTTAMKDKPGPVAISPSMAYVMLRSNVAIPLYLMRVPSVEDQANYDKMRADALVKARAKYVKRKKEYEGAVKYNRELPDGAQRQPLPEQPVEPTEANFEYTPFPLLAGVSIGPLNRFAKGDGGSSTYLQELTPGEYRIYGPLTVLPNGAAAGGCFCMGTIAFVAQAGEIVDLGMIEAKTNVKRPEGDSSAPIPADGPLLVPAAGAPDARLASARIVAAHFRPVGKLPNYYGVTIARMPEIPGVMRYDRDKIVDLTTSGK